MLFQTLTSAFALSMDIKNFHILTLEAIQIICDSLGEERATSVSLNVTQERGVRTSDTKCHMVSGGVYSKKYHLVFEWP